MSASKPAAYCPKSDEGVKSAVKQGAIVIGLGKEAEKVADKLRSALAHRAKPGDNWEETKVNHLVVVVECLAMNGDCCEAAQKFMRRCRGSDGYGVYSDIIGRRVAVLGLGKMGKVAGASKVEEVLLKRGGCKTLVKIGRVELPAAEIATASWTQSVCEALDETMDPPAAAAKEDASSSSAAVAAKEEAAAAVTAKELAGKLIEAAVADAEAVSSAAPPSTMQAPPRSQLPAAKVAAQDCPAASGTPTTTAMVLAVVTAAVLLGGLAFARRSR